jgi:hypothetical protein
MQSVLANDLLTEWLVKLEERVRAIEASLSPRVTWGVSQAELTETKKKSEK